MKKILFVMRYPLIDEYNLKLKFTGQMKACVNLGYDVSYIAYDEKNYYLCSMNGTERKKVGKTHFHSYNRYRNTVAFFDLYSALETVLKKEQFDYIYMRKKLVTGKALYVLKKYKRRGGKLIVEIPTFGVIEAPIGFLRNLAKHILAKSESRFDEIVDLYVLVGNNCPNQYKGKPAMEVVNGISLDSIPKKKHTPIDSEIHIIAVASMRYWQGFDRVISGISKYSGKERLFFHLVGQNFDGSVQKWMKAAKDMRVESNVIYHGPLYSEQLTELFDICHVAVGALALHRRGGLNGSTLKVREYTARGIPFIYAYDDSSLDGNEWFAMRFQSGEESIDFEKVVPWLKQLYSRNNVVDEIRLFAHDYMSWEEQLKPVFIRIQDI